MTPRLLTLAIALSLGTVSAQAAEFYVHKDGGKNSFPGTSEQPFKNLQKAIDKAEDGDTIYVAEGNYCGIMDRGQIKLNKQVTILGGYSSDFSERDILQYRTTVIPPNKPDIHRDDAIILVEQGNRDGTTVIDGFIFDQGETNDYHETKGRPEGLMSGMFMVPPTRSSSTAVPTANIAMIKGNASGDFTVSNSVFNNAAHYGIWVAQGKGTFTVKNSVFTANRMSAIEVRGRMNDHKQVKVNLENNTVLFTWSRTKEMEDMGYGVRAMTGADYDIKGNILALSTFAGYDNTRIDSNLSVRKNVALDNNMFFLNKEADMTAPGSGKFMRLWVEEHFEDLPDLDVPGTTFTSTEDNVGLDSADPLKSAINTAYLDGFLSASYSEVSSYDADSPANTFRRAMGLNQMGTINSTVTMWANRYPLEDSLKLFGAVPGYGAQLPE